MTRKKVKLALIANESARKATYKKRTKGLLKKVEELSTLCDIEACAIVYSPYDPQPEVWPTNQWGLERVLAKFRTMPQMDQSKKMMNQESFLKQMIMKTSNQVKKQVKDNRDKEMTLFMFQLLNAGKVMLPNNMDMGDVSDLSWLIDQNLKDVTKRLETLDLNPQLSAPSQPQVAEIPTPALGKNEGMTMEDQGYGFDMNANLVQNQQFLDFIHGNGNGTMPYGHLNFQNGFWSNMLP